jgi:hypothetical protein
VRAKMAVMNRERDFMVMKKMAEGCAP